MAKQIVSSSGGPEGSGQRIGALKAPRQGFGTPQAAKRGMFWSAEAGLQPDQPKQGFSTPQAAKRGFGNSDHSSGKPGKQKKVIFCPIEKHANAILRSGKQMVSAMHRLRRNLCKCRRCPAFGACEFRENFNQLIDAVILEINEEWGLS